MVTKVQKWGNSLGLRIPKSYAEEADIVDGSQVEISVQDGDLLIHSVEKRKFDLDDLLKQVRKDNLHDEINTGDPVGDEAW
jgi:antitoxin MazE